ncbi:MAG: hypothetical protein JNK05_21230 [Myxococcales bacterium]|nr:hypothetical protein [Myxococcales bacterium]
MTDHVYTEEERKRLARGDRASAALGVVSAIAIHVVVLALSLRAGTAEGNAARPAGRPDNPQEAPEEMIVEGELLRQGGGGRYDPRIHREAPVRAEESNVRERGPNHDPNANTAQRRDPNAAITDRDILGRGNQDLAERRLQQLAENEGADPNAPPGPGSPDGSVHGTETNPNRAGSGAGAKIQSFLRRELRFPSTAPAEARSRPFRLRIVISDDGATIARGRVVEGSGDETVDSDLNLQLAEIAANHRQIPELTDEEKLAIRGRTFGVRYRPE